MEANNTKKITSMNTHDYDTLLKDSYKKYVEIDDEILDEPISFENTLGEIAKHIEFSGNQKTIVLKTISLLQNDRKENYDNKNNINIEDLLPRTWRFIKHYDKPGIECFVEQLTDIITSGPCAQGRTTRVFQFYEYHMSNKDEIYDKCVKTDKTSKN